MSIQKDQVAEVDTTEQTVIDYLRENPDFFVEQSKLLASLNIPHEVSGSAISLIEYQVKVLRERNEKLSRKLKEIITNARNNDSLNDRMISMAGALIREEGVNERIRVIIDCLHNDFKVDAVSIKLYDPNDFIRNNSYVLDNACEDTHKLFRHFLGSKRPLCGQLRVEQLRYLFKDKASSIYSAALVPVGRKLEYGFIAMGSVDRHRFHAGKDIMFLSHLSDLFGDAFANRLFDSDSSS